GIDSVSYRAYVEMFDPHAQYGNYYYWDNSDPATIYIVVGDANAPLANPDEYTIQEDSSLEVDAAQGLLSNDSDADGDPITPSLLTGPEHGALDFNADGSFAYRPIPDYSGPDSFVYQ